jgi:hypothetical protein
MGSEQTSVIQCLDLYISISNEQVAFRHTFFQRTCLPSYQNLIKRGSKKRNSFLDETKQRSCISLREEGSATVFYRKESRDGKTGATKQDSKRET